MKHKILFILFWTFITLGAQAQNTLNIHQKDGGIVSYSFDEMPEGLPGTRYSSIFTRDDIEEAILYVPERLYDFYRIRDPWKYFGIIKTLKEEDSISAAEMEDDPKDAEYYTIQGNKVDAPVQSGIYVVRSGKKTKTVSITQ